MSLSPHEKALAEAAYARVRVWRKYRGGGFAGIFIGLVPVSTSIFKTIIDPHSSHREVAVLSGLMGLAWGAGILSSFLAAGRRKRDEAFIRLIENHFPDECSWKQEEKILAEAEDIRLKAKVDLLIHQDAR